MFRRENLSQVVAEDILFLIRSQGYKPMDRLPSEYELMDMLNVSRSTVREAIKILISRGILEIKRGRGTYICQQPGKINDPLGVQYMEEKNLRRAFFEIRLILEPNMIELAVKRSTKTDVQDIEKHYYRLIEQIEKGENHTDADISFHNAIAKATHNPIMGKILPIIHEGILLGIRSRKSQKTPPETLIEQHQNIMEAIWDREPAKAKEAMEAHLLYWFKNNKEES